MIKYNQRSLNSSVRVSIIIPALNEADRIEAAIHRALATNPYEVLLVDGGSQDDTVNIARGLSCRVVESPRGRALQQNAGASQATGDVLLFLHADSWLPPDGIDQVQRAMSAPKVLAGAFWQHIEASGLRYRLLEVADALRVIYLRLPFGDQGIFIRREVFEQLGGFPEVRLMEEVLLMRRLRTRTRIALLPGPLHTSARRWQEHGCVRQTIRNWILLVAEQCGVSPNRLADFYLPHWKKK